jgi:hypothetical protein
MNHEDQMHPQNKLEKYLNARQLHQIHLLIDPDSAMTMPIHLLSSEMVLSPDFAYFTMRNQHEDTNRRRRRESIVINLSSPLSHSTTLRSLSNLQPTPSSASRSTKSSRNASQSLQLLNDPDQMHPQNTLEKYLHARHLHQNHPLIDPDGVMTMPLHLLSSEMVLSPDLA